MSIKFEKIKEGMTLYDVRKSSNYWNECKYDYWTVRVISVNLEDRTVVATWNNNNPETMNEGRITKFRAKLPKE